MLSVQNLKVRYGATEVLSNVSFFMCEGRVLTLLGGNGSGKTTLLNALSGLTKAAAGSITFHGKEITRASPRTILRSGLAQIPQGREVFSTMTVHENLLLGATVTARSETPQMIDEVFELFPMLKTRRADPAGRLSGGEQQQLAIGRALVSKPKVLLMDEPSAGLSPMMVDRMIEALNKLHSRGLSIFLVEQNVGVAAAVADDALVLKDGRIGLSMPADKLLANPEVLASYLGR
jgi:branched-chain amino acid transport system ATP-binding protein